MVIVQTDNIEVHKLELEIEQTCHITNTYIIKDKQSGKVCVIDPAFDEKLIQKTIEDIAGMLDLVIVTHSHADHIAALAKLVENTDAKVYIYALDYDGLWDKKLNEEDIVKTKVMPVERNKINVVQDKDIIYIGETKMQIIHTPGHTKGSMCLLDKTNNMLYSGDTIFEKTYGRTDLITGSHEDMKLSLDKLLDMFEDILVLPGHGNIFNLKDSKRKIRLLFAYKG